MGKNSDLSPECQKFVKKLFAFFNKEKATKKPIVSFDMVYQKTSKALGVSYTSVHRINGKRPFKSNRPKERAKILDDFDHCVIKITIHGLYSRKIAPTVSIIHKEIKDSIKISKSKLTLTLIDLGYTYKKISDNRRVLYDRISTRLPNPRLPNTILPTPFCRIPYCRLLLKMSKFHHIIFYLKKNIDDVYIFY